MPNSPTARPRQGGGFNQGFGNFSDEHLDENAVSQAAQQHQLGQQGSNPGQTTGSQHIPPGQSAIPKPRQEMGSLWEELVKEPAKDIFKGLLSLFDFSQALGLSKPADSKPPEEQVKLQQMHARYQKLNQEQQAFAQKRYQEMMQKKKLEEQENLRKKQLKKQQEAQAFEMPTSPSKGPVGPSGSKKKQAATRLQQNRQQLNGPSSVD